MKAKRKLNIWTIIILAVAIFLIGLLIYNWFFTPSQAISVAKFEEIMSKEIKKKFDKNSKEIEELAKAKEGSKNIQELKITNKESKFIIQKIDIYRSVYPTASIAVEYLDFNGKTNKISFVVQQEDFANFKKKTFDIWKENNKILVDKKVISHTALPISLWSVFLNYLPTLLIFAWIFFIFFRTAGGGALGGLTGSFKATELTKANVRFQDVAGIVEEKKELLEIVNFLKKPDKYLKMGARIPKGLLLFGPPGTGKTLLAKAVSGESDVPFFSVSGSEFEEVLVGLGASRIRQLFKKAKQSAPCIIFIDEIDSLGGNRNQGMGVKDQTLNQFLAAMDGFDNTIGVVIIAATNRADVLDPALLRSGRFDRKIQISLPNVKERIEILKIHSRNKNIDKDVNFDNVANRTPGFTGAQLENSLNEAALLAVRKDKTVINDVDIDEGIDRVIGGPAKYSQIISEKTRLLISIHESGHALLGLLVNDAFKVQKITIIPRGAAGGYTIITPKDESRLYSKQILEDQLIGILGGRAAEEVVFGPSQITTGGHDDFSKASAIAQRMVQQFGMSPAGLRYFPDANFMPGYVSSGTASLSEFKKKENDRYIDWILEDCFVKAKKIVQKNFELLYLLAEALLVLETIASEDIDYIYKNNKLPERVLNIKKNNPDKKFLDLDLIKNDPKSAKTKKTS